LSFFFLEEVNTNLDPSELSARGGGVGGGVAMSLLSSVWVEVEINTPSLSWWFLSLLEVEEVNTDSDLSEISATGGDV
jgi:hypothetical protein